MKEALKILAGSALLLAVGWAGVTLWWFALEVQP